MQALGAKNKLLTAALEQQASLALTVNTLLAFLPTLAGGSEAS